MADRTRANVQESPAYGGTQLDDFGPRPLNTNQDGLDARSYFIQNDSSSDSSVEISRDASDRMIFKDDENTTPVTLSELLAGIGGGISESQHENLDTLVHNIAETHYREVTYSNGEVTDVVWWTDNGKTIKVREMNMSYSSGLVSSIVYKQYDGLGVLTQTITDTFSYTNGEVVSIDSVET